MAFDTLGVNLVAGGIRGVANDIGHLALSFLRYVRAVEQADRASLKTAASQSKLADTMAGKAQRSVDRLEKQYLNLTIKSKTLKAAIDALHITMRDPVAAQTGYAKALAEVQHYEQAVINFQATMRRTKAGNFYKRDVAVLNALKQSLANANVELQKQARNYAASIKEQARYEAMVEQLNQVTREFVGVQDELSGALDKDAEAFADAADKQQQYQDALAAAGQQTNIFGRLLSDLTGGFGQSTASNSALIKGLSLTVPQLTAVMVAMDAMKLAIRAAQIVMTITVKVIQTLWNAFKKLVGMVWDVAKAIGKTLWGALTKIAGAPFKLIASLFGGMHGSMQRVMEMAIGMNLSRVWWQLGMKMRDMARMASDAAVDYQVTFNRLRSLILNEIVDTQYAGNISSIEQRAEALKKAQLATEELVMWTSKLAVSTIYDAADILDVYTLAMAYNFTSDSARNLTEAVLDFATGMGLGDTEMRRVIENFGQLRAQGKITGTELRDLARGAFVPVNDVLEQMAKNAGLVGDYDIPNMQAINGVLADMRDNGELTADAFAAISIQLQKIGADGRVTRQEFETLMQDMSEGDVMQRFGLTAEQAGKALEGIKTGQLTEELNELIKTGELTIDEFFEAFIEIAENRFPNAARSMGMTMKAVKSNIEDYISTMIGWRLIAPVFEVMAKHTQDFIQNVLMSDKQIALFDKMGKAFKVVTELLLTYSNAVQKARLIGGTFFSSGPLTQLRKFAKEFISILGSLGTEDFDKQMGLFDFALKSIDLSFGSRNIVTSGIKSLNKIMQDIMAGVEIDPTELKKAMDDVFGTLWKEFFGPKIKESLETAWEDHIKPAIGRLWDNMVTAFGNWKTDKLVPGLKTFFDETLPGFITGFSNWIGNNGPQIVTDIGTFVTDLLNEFEQISTKHLGQENPLTLLIGLLSDLSTYGTFKLADPTSDINQANLEKAADSFTKLKDAVIAMSYNKLLESEPVQKFIKSWNSPDVQKGLEVMGSFFNTVKEAATIAPAPVFALIGLVMDALSSVGMSEGESEPIYVAIEVLEGFVAVAGLLTAIPSTGLTGVVAIIDIFPSLARTLQMFNWDKNNSIIKNIQDLLTLFAQNWVGGNAVETFSTLVDKVAGIVEKIFGIDDGALRTKVRNIWDAIYEFLNMTPKDWPPLPVDIDYELHPRSMNPNYDFDENGNLIYVGGHPQGGPQKGRPTINEVVPIDVKPLIRYAGPPGWTVDESGNLVWLSPGTLVADGVQILIPVEMTPVSKSSFGKPPTKAELIKGWLGGDWGKTGDAFNLDPIEIEAPEITVTSGGKKVLPSIMGSDFGTEFTSGLTTAVANVEVTLPESFGGNLSTSLQTAVTNAASVLSSDTSIAEGGKTMINTLAAAVENAAQNVVSKVEEMASAARGPVDNMRGPFQEAGSNAVAGLRLGMEGQMRSLLTWWEIQVTKLNNIVPTLNMQNSPSRLYRSYGEDMMKGLQLGLESGQKGAVAQMHDAAIELRQTLGAINSGSTSPQQYSNISNTTNWNVNVSTPLVASTPIQAYEILRMRAR